MRFNLGDEVRRVEEHNAGTDWTLRVGAVGIVVRISTPDHRGYQWLDLSEVRNNNGEDVPEDTGGGHDSTYFELVRTAAQVRADQERSTALTQHANARKDDPSTSKQAAKPLRIGLRQLVLDAIKAHGGANGHEIEAVVARPLNSITPRLAELRKAGRIKDSGTRRDGQIVWVAV